MPIKVIMSKLFHPEKSQDIGQLLVPKNEQSIFQFKFRFFFLWIQTLNSLKELCSLKPPSINQARKKVKKSGQTPGKDHEITVI